MAKIEVTPITSGYNVAALNETLQNIEDEFKNKVVYRDEVSPMERALDMNGKDILNADSIVANSVQVGGAVITEGEFASDSSAVLRGDLVATSGATLVGSDDGAGGSLWSTVAGFISRWRNLSAVTLDSFIPNNVDTSTTDVREYVQAAIIAGAAAGKDIVGTPGKVYTISGPLLIPQNHPAPTFVKAKKYKIDGNGCIFRRTADNALFESAYDNGGVLTSNYGTALDAHYSVGITLTNFGIESAIGPLSQPQLKIQDWHQQCAITRITSGVAQQMMWANNCYYTKFDDISAGTLGPARVGTRFKWDGNTNLCKISRLVAVNSVVGYRFDGPVTATVLESMSFEGVDIGAMFNATVYDVAIRDSYIEGFYDVAIQFNDYVEGAVIDNNYVNFLNLATSYFVQYAPLPGTNVTVTRSNYFYTMPSDANIIKGREDNYGEGVVIERPTQAASSINEYKIDNAIIGRRVDWRQKKTKPGVIAHVHNDVIPGNYSSRFSDGWANENGYEWVNTGTNTLAIRTRITQNFVQLVYVNIEVTVNGGAPVRIAGMFIGNQFYKATESTFAPSTDLLGGTDGAGFFKIDGGYFFAGTVTAAKGEIRLI